VKVGRRDSTAAFKALANSGELPGFKDTLDQLSGLFSKKGLNTRDLVALSGRSKNHICIYIKFFFDDSLNV